MTPPEPARPAEIPTAAYESPRSRRRLAWSLVLLALVSIGLWLLPRSDGSLARVHAAGVLRIGYAVDAPFAMLSPGGDITGQAPETARMVAEQMGLARIDWVQTDLNNLLNGLAERRYDMVASGLFITRERASKVLFSEPTLQVKPGWLTLRHNPKALSSYASTLNQTGLRVAVVQGSVEQAQLRALGLAEPAMLAVPNGQAGMALVLAGAVDGLARPLPSVRRLAATEPEHLEAVVAGTQPGEGRPEYAAFAFHRHDVELQAAWNQAQAQVVGSPRHLAMLAGFGFDAEDLPGVVHTADILHP